LAAEASRRTPPARPEHLRRCIRVALLAGQQDGKEAGLGEQDMFLISDGLGRVGHSVITEAFLDTRTGSHDDAGGADLGRSGKKARKPAPAAFQLQQLQVVYTEESFTRRRERKI